MNIVFFGTPEFSIPSLDVLVNSRHRVSAVVTTPDRQQGRGLKTIPSPVKQFALQHKIPVLQPENFLDNSFLESLKQINADLFVVVAFKILPPEVYNLPKYGSFNLHGSILPKYRGAAPIQWALINGDSETGVTTFKLEEKVDTGNVYLIKKTTILPDENFGSLHNKLSIIGSEAVLETVDLIESGEYKLITQDNTLATRAPKITKELCELDWSASAKSNHNKVRALSPYPGAYFRNKGKNYKILKSGVSDYSDEIGKIIENNKEILICCNQGALIIKEIQPEGKKKMSAEEFLRGNTLL